MYSSAAESTEIVTRSFASDDRAGQQATYAGKAEAIPEFYDATTLNREIQ